MACIEEIAYRSGYIDKEQLLRLARPLAKSAYGRYLMGLAEDEGSPGEMRDKANQPHILA